MIIVQKHKDFVIDVGQDLGPAHFDKRAQAKQVHRLIDRLRNLGFAVQITPMEAAA